MSTADMSLQSIILTVCSTAPKIKVVEKGDRYDELNRKIAPRDIMNLGKYLFVSQVQSIGGIHPVRLCVGGFSSLGPWIVCGIFLVAHKAQISMLRAHGLDCRIAVWVGPCGLAKGLCQYTAKPNMSLLSIILTVAHMKTSENQGALTWTPSNKPLIIKTPTTWTPNLWKRPYASGTCTRPGHHLWPCEDIGP